MKVFYLQIYMSSFTLWALWKLHEKKQKKMFHQSQLRNETHYIDKSLFSNTQSHWIYHDFYLPDIAGNDLKNPHNQADLDQL